MACFNQRLIIGETKNKYRYVLTNGLPIISSNRSFNWDVLDESNSVMVDPTSIDEIASAIQELRDDVEKRERLSKGSLERAKSLTIEKRAEAIIGFMRSRAKLCK